MKSSPLYTSCLYSIPSNVHIVGIEYTQGICPPTFAVNDFSKLFWHPSIILIKDSRSAQIIDGFLSDFWHWLNYNVLVSLEGITAPRKSLFSHTLFMILKFVFCSKRMKTIKQWKSPTCFDVIPLNTEDYFFAAR